METRRRPDPNPAVTDKSSLAFKKYPLTAFSIIFLYHSPLGEQLCECYCSLCPPTPQPILLLKHTHPRAGNQPDDNKDMHGSLNLSSPRSLLQLNHSHPVKPGSSPKGALLTKWSLPRLSHNVFNICDNRVVLLWSQAKVAFKGAPGGSLFHVCAFWVCGAFAARPLARPWKWGRSDRADSLFPNKQRLACCLTHIPILPDRLSEVGYKGPGVVKTWHSQKRAAGPKVNQETSHMTQRCRNDRTARVSDEGPLNDIASSRYFCPTALISELILQLPWVWADFLKSVRASCSRVPQQNTEGGADVSLPSLDASTGPTSELLLKMLQ